MMSNQPQPTPDALEAGARALFLRERKYHTPTMDCPEPPNWEDLTDTSIEHYRDNARAVLAAAQPEVQANSKPNQNLESVTSVEEADNLPVGSVIILRNGTARLRTHWSSGWASAKAGDDYPTDDKGCFPARVLHRPEANDA